MHMLVAEQGALWIVFAGRGRIARLLVELPGVRRLNLADVADRRLTDLLAVHDRKWAEQRTEQEDHRDASHGLNPLVRFTSVARRSLRDKIGRASCREGGGINMR